MGFATRWQGQYQNERKIKRTYRWDNKNKSSDFGQTTEIKGQQKEHEEEEVPKNN